MKLLLSGAALALIVSVVGAGVARADNDSAATDESKAKQGARQVESGAKQVGHGVADTAKGVGKTVAGGAETAGHKIKEAGEAAKPEAKSAWGHVRDGAVSFGHSVKTFFTRPFRKDTDDNGRTGS